MPLAPKAGLARNLGVGVSAPGAPDTHPTPPPPHLGSPTQGGAAATLALHNTVGQQPPRSSRATRLGNNPEPGLTLGYTDLALGGTVPPVPPPWERGSPDRVLQAQALPARVGKLGWRGMTHTAHPERYWEALGRADGRREAVLRGISPPPGDALAGDTGPEPCSPGDPTAGVWGSSMGTATVAKPRAGLGAAQPTCGCGGFISQIINRKMCDTWGEAGTRDATLCPAIAGCPCCPRVIHTPCPCPQPDTPDPTG